MYIVLPSPFESSLIQCLASHSTLDLCILPSKRYPHGLVSIVSVLSVQRRRFSKPRHSFVRAIGSDHSSILVGGFLAAKIYPGVFVLHFRHPLDWIEYIRLHTATWGREV